MHTATMEKRFIVRGDAMLTACGTAKGDTRVRGEFGLVMAVQNGATGKTDWRFWNLEAGLVAERQEATSCQP